MAFILSIETATRACSVALHEGESLLASSEVLVEKSHSKIITILIDTVLKAAGVDYSQLNAVAVSKGPGSYTGLRIGVSTAKGLCYGLKIPLIGINTLEAMAFEVNKYNKNGAMVCPMLDARRMEVYCAILDDKNKYIEPTNARIIDEDSFSDLLSEKQLFFFGDGSIKTQKMLYKSKNAIFLENIYPSARNIGFLGLINYQAQVFEDLIYFEPFYLKEFISTSGQKQS